MRILVVVILEKTLREKVHNKLRVRETKKRTNGHVTNFIFIFI